MATLILSSVGGAVGGAVGGPIGAAVGAVLGQQFDGAVFAPRTRRGPRLGELAVQTSSYGSPIPKIFGTMRVAGTVIWSTDLKEEKSKNGNGKGRAKSIDYSYSASFAVALSGRPIRAVRRIWADGKLLRGAAGDFKTETGFRLYHGSEEQAVDPLIASIEGDAPAYRGIAYALFEDFQLGDFGNRIPSLTFEVEADAESVAMGRIAEELSGGEMQDGGTPLLLGYAASGESIRGLAESLAEVVPLSLMNKEGRPVLTASPAAPGTVGRADEGAEAKGGAGGRSEIMRCSAAGIAGEIAITYHDVERDFQTGLQRASQGGPALRSERIAFSAALRAGAAKAFAERKLSHAWANRETGKLHLPLRRSSIRPGELLRSEGRAGLWKVASWTLDRMVVSLDLVRVPQSGGRAESIAASPGRATGEPDQVHGPTTLFLFELPMIEDRIAAGSQVFAAAAGAEAGWRRAALVSSHDGGGSWAPEGPTAGPAVIGHAATILAGAGSALIDDRNTVEVALLNADMWLEGRSDAALAAGGNLALLGDELIQFGRAEPLGTGRFRLSRLLRGRRGSEWAVSAQQAGERFVLLERESLKLIDLPSGAAGGELRIGALGLGDADEKVALIAAIEGQAVRPPAPVHLRASRLAGGDIAFEWVRRSRGGWSWPSGSDTPLVEEREAYRLVLGGLGFQRTVETTQAAYTYTAAQQEQDGNPAALTVEVAQVGTLSVSRPARIHLG